MYTQYASTLFEGVQRHLIGIHGYADDHGLYLDFCRNTEGSEKAALDTSSLYGRCENMDNEKHLQDE